ncbi:AAA family ATPase [Paraburkholderia tuberum]|uniref:Transitional endoplasmic reticulum ATPase n=1 Tax=Paraburkholderia tuberum TaxID=157910 RepID=A0A1H1KGQ4_9BURK|nr:AAA family ATPase [Paraburkholderia tuberum]SDR60945.1 transitional endoplasmic reticulum ATPase [Paraburkholderia tuberum]
MKNLYLVLPIVGRATIVFLCFAFLSHEWRTLFQHGSVHIPAAAVATLVAASLVWLPNQNVRGWTWIAFIVLANGMMLVALTFTAWSIAAIAAIAAASFKLWRLHQRRTPARMIVDGTRVIIPLEMKITPQCVPVVAHEKRASEARSTQAAPAKEVPPARELPVMPAPAPQPAPMQKPRAEPAQQVTTPTWDFSENVRKPRHNFSALVGMQDTKSRLFRTAQEILEGTSKKRKNGILLYGEAGNGKTLLAEGLAGQLNVPFLSISYGDTASKWVNETPAKVKAVFIEARRIGSCLLFIDEIDSFIKPRDGNVHSMDRDLTNVMLTEIVGLRGSKVILVAATNFLDHLDGSGTREGRFDYKIEIPAPDLAARISLLWRSITEELGDGFAQREPVSALARRWEGFSAARLTALGGQLREMHRDAKFTGPVTFEIGMKAMRLLQGRKGHLPEGVKDICEIIMPDTSCGALRNLAYRMRETENLEKLGSTLPRGVLFVGRPGTGKSHAAMALAKSSNFAFLNITGADIISDPRSWDRLYREACDIRPCVIFIDEVDGILQDRRYTSHGMLTEKILVTLDGAASGMPDVIFIGATNYGERIDPAALRSGRFEEKILFDVPTNEAMAAYVRAILAGKLNGAWKVEPGAVVQMIRLLAGRTIADADALVRKAITLAALRRMRERTADFRVADVVQGAQAIFA